MTTTRTTPQHTPTPCEITFGRLVLAVLTDDTSGARELASSARVEFPTGEPAVIDPAHAVLVEALEDAIDFEETRAAKAAVHSGLGVSEWESFTAPWFSSARAALAAAKA